MNVLFAVCAIYVGSIFWMWMNLRSERKLNDQHRAEMTQQRKFYEKTVDHERDMRWKKSA